MTVIRDILLLIARAIVGGVLIGHGLQKLNDFTIDGTADNFESMNIPYADIAAQFQTYFELAGGIAIVVGLLVRLVGPVLFVTMAVAAWYAHRESGFYVTDGGWEYVAVMGAAGFALAAAGAGRVSLDHLVVAPFRKRKEAKANAEAHNNQAANYDYSAQNQNFGTGAGVGAGAGAGAATGSTADQGVLGNSSSNFNAGGQDFSTQNLDNKEFNTNVNGHGNANGLTSNNNDGFDTDTSTTQFPDNRG